MKTKAVALFLVVLVVGAEASKLALMAQVFGIDVENMNALGDTANINHYVDQVLANVKAALEGSGLDPMPIPDMHEGFYYRPLLITYRGHLWLYDGKMTGVSTSLQRGGDCTVNYFVKMLRIQILLRMSDLDWIDDRIRQVLLKRVVSLAHQKLLANLTENVLSDLALRMESANLFHIVEPITNTGFTNLIDYTYNASVMDIGPTGGAHAHLRDVRVLVDLLFDFNNDELHLQGFRIIDHGRLSVRISGNFLTDWFMSPVIAVFTALLNNTIMRYIEETIRDEIIAQIAAFNVIVAGIMGNH